MDFSNKSPFLQIKRTFICKKWLLFVKNIKGAPSENFKIKFFYKRKFNKKLRLMLKFHSEHVKHGLKVF